MPNWCSNTLTVRGKKEDLDNFISKIGIDEDKHYTIISSLYPVPEEFKEDNKWYYWSIEHWGCKWDDSATSMSMKSDIAAIFTFETPWSPPVGAFNTISEMFPTLIFYLYYIEEGMGFEGYAKWMNGKCIDEKTVELSHIPEDEFYLEEEGFDRICYKEEVKEG